MKKQENYTESLIQLLNSAENRSLAALYRAKAGLPTTGIKPGTFDTAKHNIHRVAQNLGVYKAHLIVRHPELYDTLISQDGPSIGLWNDYFLYGTVSETSRTEFNPFGCEIFTLPDGVVDRNIALPKGVYIRFGTNNSLKNLKDFVTQNSRKIIESQSLAFGAQKVPILKFKKHELRDKVIATLFFMPITQLKKQAIEYGLEKELAEIYQYSAIEAKEKIIVLFVWKLFKQKIRNGTIRSIAETNKNLLD